MDRPYQSVQVGGERDDVLTFEWRDEHRTRAGDDPDRPRVAVEHTRMQRLNQVVSLREEMFEFLELFSAASGVLAGGLQQVEECTVAWG